MRLSGSRAYYRSTPPKMPPGLVELIEGLTREVLKNNPSDIYGFCAGHVQQLLEIRDRPLQKKTLTLEEKIAKAQEKVRKRAEQRRNKYNNDVFNQPSGKEPEIGASSINKDNTPLIQPQESISVNVQEKPYQNDLDLDNKTEAEPSHELDKASEGPQNQEIKDIQDHDEIKHEIKSENINSEDKKWKSQSKTNLAELPNEASDSIITQASDLKKSPNTDTPESKIEMLDHSRAPSTDGQIANAEVLCLKENQECVADAGDKHEPAEVTSNSERKLSSSIDSVTINQNYEKVTDEKVSNVLSDKTVELGDQNSPTSKINVIPNENTETLRDNITVPLNKADNQSSNQTMSNQNFIDPDVTDQSNIDNVELTAYSVDTVKNKVNLQETKTYDISFKESPTVELQDSQINPEMLESILDINTDSDIVTLLTHDSTNAELNSTSVDLQQNGLKNTAANAETPEVYKDNSDTNGIISIHEELQENIGSKNVINSFDLIENINKENEHNKIDNNCDENSLTKLGEDTQIHHQDGNMDLETAAVTIQKVFRTFLFKSRASTFDDTVNDETFMNEADMTQNKEECGFTITSSLNERRPHGITRMDTVLQTVNEEKSLSLSTDDSSTISSAASVIQAHVRGFLVRNKLNSNKTVSTNSLAATNSNEPSLTSLEMENEQNKNKTILNIHIVPEGGNYLSRDESLITSMDLSLDSSPPSSINLHPLGYDKSERRKQLKREDAIQSISPPSNNSGKLSEDVDSVKELPLNDNEITEEHEADNYGKDNMDEGTNIDESKKEPDAKITLEKTISDNVEKLSTQNESEEKINSDEMDVVTPFISNGDNNSLDKNLMHSGEFHDAVLPTKVSRSDTTVASEFKNVLVYFLLWNHS